MDDEYATQYTQLKYNAEPDNWESDSANCNVVDINADVFVCEGDYRLQRLTASG